MKVWTKGNSMNFILRTEVDILDVLKFVSKTITSMKNNVSEEDIKELHLLNSESLDYSLKKMGIEYDSFTEEKKNVLKDYLRENLLKTQPLQCTFGQGFGGTDGVREVEITFNMNIEKVLNELNISPYQNGVERFLQKNSDSLYQINSITEALDDLSFKTHIPTIFTYESGEVDIDAWANGKLSNYTTEKYLAEHLFGDKSLETLNTYHTPEGVDNPNELFSIHIELCDKYGVDVNKDLWGIDVFLVFKAYDERTEQNDTVLKAKINDYLSPSFKGNLPTVIRDCYRSCVRIAPKIQSEPQYYVDMDRHSYGTHSRFFESWNEDEYINKDDKEEMERD